MARTDCLNAYHFYEREWESYEDLYESFEWEISEKFNIAAYVCDRWVADKGRVALFAETEDGHESTHTFWQLRRRANQLANYLESRGVGRGDRVAMTGSQKPEMLVSMLATWKLGGIAVPVSAMYGTEGLRYRLDDSGASIFVVDDDNVDIYREISEDLDTVEAALVVDAEPAGDEVTFRSCLEDQSAEYETAATESEEPALLIYTSGTTGDPKGVVHPHRSLLGQLPGFVFKHMNMEIRDDDVLWTLVEWSWIGIIAFVLPMLFYGRPIVGYARTDFDPEAVLQIIEKYGVTFSNFSPTAVRMMQNLDEISAYDLGSIRVLSSGSEKVGPSIVEWIRETFDEPVINVGYGQSECILPTGECEAFGKQKRGSIGVAVPGQDVRLLDQETAEPTVPVGEVGEIGVRYEGNPICFTEYWNKPEQMEQKVKNGWLRTEDLGRRDEEGYFCFESRKDDVIISSGYRIGPEEIEESLATHDLVAEAAVVGVPHDTRGEIPKAFVELADGREGTEEPKEKLQSHVKGHLAKYEYPRELEFVEELPKTSTNKIRRESLREKEGLTETDT